MKTLDHVLLHQVKQGFAKQAFIPADQMNAGGPPGGAPPAGPAGAPSMDPSATGGMPPGGMPPGMTGDPGAGGAGAPAGAPPADPAAAGGAPAGLPPGIDPSMLAPAPGGQVTCSIQDLVTLIQAVSGGGAAKPKAGAGKGGSSDDKLDQIIQLLSGAGAPPAPAPAPGLTQPGA